MDPSMRNWGLAKGTLDLDSMELKIGHLDVIQAVELEGKQIRVNSQDLHVAQQLYQGAATFLEGVQFIFVEVPIGSQSARAMASYGICVGVLGGLRAAGRNFHEVTPTEVKMAGHGTKTATKQQMITWASTTHPEAPWPLYKQKGELKVSEAKAEHMADAIAAIHAGIRLPQFQQTLNLLRQFHANPASIHKETITC